MLAKTVCGALTAAIIAVATTALAHSTLETSQASPNSTYKGVLRVPHGCKGEATRTVRIQIPETIIDVRPMPKAGWTLTTARGAYAKSYNLYGKPVADGVKEIVWSGGELPDAFYDEFVFRARITAEAAGKTLAFPVVQECQNGSERWVEIAADGQDPHTLKAPAPTLKIAGTAAAAGSAYRVGALVIEAPWSRATPGGAKVAGGYAHHQCRHRARPARRRLAARGGALCGPRDVDAGRGHAHAPARDRARDQARRNRRAQARRLPYHVHGPDGAAEGGPDAQRARFCSRRPAR